MSFHLSFYHFTERVHVEFVESNSRDEWLTGYLEFYVLHKIIERLLITFH